MKKAIAVLIAVVLAFAAGFVCCNYYLNNYSNSYDSSAIEEKVSEMSELTTFKVEYTDEASYTGDAKKILGYDIPFTKKAMRIKYSGTVKMGPELQNNLTVDLNDAGDKATVTIPHSDILSHEIDENSIQIVYVKNGVFNSVTPENTNTLRKESKKAKEKSIKESDYLDQADEYAVSQIKSLLESVYPDLQVEVKVR